MGRSSERVARGSVRCKTSDSGMLQNMVSSLTRRVARFARLNPGTAVRPLSVSSLRATRSVYQQLPGPAARQNQGRSDRAATSLCTVSCRPVQSKPPLRLLTLSERHHRRRIRRDPGAALASARGSSASRLPLLRAGYFVIPVFIPPCSAAAGREMATRVPLPGSL